MADPVIDIPCLIFHNSFMNQYSDKSAHIIHPLQPIWNSTSRILILGTMPSPKSREYGFYYMHPQNRFWPVLAALFGEQLHYQNNGIPVSQNKPAENGSACLTAAVTERKALLLAHRLALWDVLASCDIHGADDASITRPVPNDFLPLLCGSSIIKVFTTGKTAYTLYTKLCEPVTHIQAVCLPSTSPANRGRWPLEKLIETYRVLTK